MPPALAGAGLAPTVVADGALDRVGEAGTSQGVLAIGLMPRARPLDVRPPAPVLVLVLWELADPGNVGTLIRSAEAAGAAAVWCRGGVDLWSPKVVRAAAGALFRLPVAVVDDPLAGLAEAGLGAVAAVARGGLPYDEVDLSGPVGLLIGSEAHGLPQAVVDGCAAQVTIGLAGPTESLNAAMAGTVLLFEALRQRRAQR